jgi:hypothetical protein
MPDFIHDFSENDLALFFAVASILAAVAGVLFLKPVLRLFIGFRDPHINETIGYGTSGYSLFYALLVGLLTVAAYQNRERIEQAVLKEAATVSTLYFDMTTYPEPLRSDMRELLRDYVLFTIHRDWPAHREGRFLSGGDNRVAAMRQTLAGFEPATPAQQILHAEVIGAFHEFLSARQARLTGVYTRIPDVLWYAVGIGAVISVVLIAMLRMRIVAHLILGSISVFYLGVILFVIVVLDDPLKGLTGLPPAPFEMIWERQMRWDEPLSPAALDPAPGG